MSETLLEASRDGMLGSAIRHAPSGATRVYFLFKGVAKQLTNCKETGYRYFILKKEGPTFIHFCTSCYNYIHDFDFFLRELDSETKPPMR